MENLNLTVEESRVRALFNECIITTRYTNDVKSK